MPTHPLECLTISLGSECNLNCLYCFSKHVRIEQYNRLHQKDLLKCISRAAELVAASCKSKNLPFFFGFQGSGEPLMHFTKLKRIYALVSAIVQQHNLSLFSFITSNGCMEEEKYHWVAMHCNRICLSIDGNEALNDRQRRSSDNKGSYARILNTIAILKQNHKIPVIRTTITRHNVHHLASMVSHFISELKLSEIQVEPVYMVQAHEDLAPAPDVFVENYLAAKRLAASFGGTLNYSGYRKNKTHGTYCNINKKVLFVGTNGTASICLFKDSETVDSPFVVGHYDCDKEQFNLDDHNIALLKKRTERRYRDCENCEIVDSCVMGCPDVCIIEKDANYSIRESLRCKINRLLFQQE